MPDYGMTQLCVTAEDMAKRSLKLMLEKCNPEQPPATMTAPVEMDAGALKYTLVTMNTRCSKAGLKVYAWYVHEHPLLQDDPIYHGVAMPDQLSDDSQQFLNKMFQKHYIREGQLQWQYELWDTDSWDNAVLDVAQQLCHEQGRYDIELTKEEIQEATTEWNDVIMEDYEHDLLTRIQLYADVA